MNIQLPTHQIRPTYQLPDDVLQPADLCLSLLETQRQYSLLNLILFEFTLAALHFS